MFRFLKCLARRLSSMTTTPGVRRTNSSRLFPRARPELEALETRLVPTITWQGGAVLTHPDVQALYLGSDWNTAAYKPQMTYINGFLNSVMPSSYLPMLGNDGYNAAGPIAIGKGTNETSKVDPAPLSTTQNLTDGTIHFVLQSYIQNGTLKAPNGNSLYLVYVEDNVTVQSGNQTSVLNFLGYHQHFAGTDARGHAVDIHYAVIDYPSTALGGNPIEGPELEINGTLTAVTSHELAEAATDPDINAWYQVSGGEVGDIVAGQIVYLNGYAVQREADQNDQPMIPVGATTHNAVNFVLQSNHTLSEYTSTGSLKTVVATGVASVSDQGIDNTGLAMVDYVKTGGAAFEYHDGGAGVSLGTVKSAVAGNGVSYILLANNVLQEYHDSTPGYNKASFTTIDTLSKGATISAGTDRFGVNAVDVLYANGGAWEYSDSTGWLGIASGVRSLSAGQDGVAAYVTTAGNAYTFHEGWGNTPSTNTFVASGVSQITAGTDQNGNTMLDLLYSKVRRGRGTAFGVLEELRTGQNWSILSTGVQSMSKGRAGLIDLVFSTGNADEHTASGLTALASNVLQAS